MLEDGGKRIVRLQLLFRRGVVRAKGTERRQLSRGLALESLGASRQLRGEWARRCETSCGRVRSDRPNWMGQQRRWDGLRQWRSPEVEKSGVWRDESSRLTLSSVASAIIRNPPRTCVLLGRLQFPALRRPSMLELVSRAHGCDRRGGQRNDARSGASRRDFPQFVLVAKNYPASTLRTVMRAVGGSGGSDVSYGTRMRRISGAICT